MLCFWLLSCVLPPAQSWKKNTPKTTSGSMKRLMRVHWQKCWQQIGHKPRTTDLDSVMFLRTEIYVKRNLHLLLVLMLEFSLSSPSITLQYSNCRKLSTGSPFPFGSYPPFCDLHLVKCSSLLSQDALVTPYVCSNLLWLPSSYAPGPHWLKGMLHLLRPCRDRSLPQFL